MKAQFSSYQVDSRPADTLVLSPSSVSPILHTVDPLLLLVTLTRSRTGVAVVTFALVSSSPPLVPRCADFLGFRPWLALFSWNQVHLFVCGSFSDKLTFDELIMHPLISVLPFTSLFTHELIY